MSWLFEMAKCIFINDRKCDDNTTPLKPLKNTPLNDENFKLIKECSWLGCGLEINDKRPIYKKARIGKKYYVFCCEECYNLCINGNYFFY